MEIYRYRDQLTRDIDEYLDIAIQRPVTKRGRSARDRLLRWYEETVLQSQRVER